MIICIKFPLQAVLIRAIVDKECGSDGEVTYNITFGHTALGHHAIDVFTARGLLAIILMTTRFVSSQPIDCVFSTATSTSESD